MTDHHPEHDKLTAVREDSETIGAFLEAVGEQGYRLMAYEERSYTELCSGISTSRGWPTDYDSGCDGGVLDTQGWWRDKRYDAGSMCPRCRGEGVVKIKEEGWFPHPGRTIEGILAAHFDIDLQKLAEEKDQMLADIRARQEVSR